MTASPDLIPASRPPFQEPDFRVPEWEDMPEDFRALLVLLFRWAHTKDGAPARCLRRVCRTSTFCMASPEDGKPCAGSPGPHVAHWVTGMWVARCLDLQYVLPPYVPEPDAD